MMKTKRKTKQKTISAKRCSTLAMVTHNDEPDLVIDEGMVKRWVGFGWVTEREAKKRDYKEYPLVVRTDT